jgi:hypothetical protein
MDLHTLSQIEWQNRIGHEREERNKEEKRDDNEIKKQGKIKEIHANKNK